MSNIINKRNIIIGLLLVLISIIVVGLYGTFASFNTDVVEFEEVNKVFNLTIGNVDNNTYTTTVSNNDSKDLNIVINNKEGIDLNYLLYYSGILVNEGVSVGLLTDSENKSHDIIEKNSNYNIGIRIINNTNTDITITIGITFGYVNGGDLVLSDSQYKIDNIIDSEDNLDSSGANKPVISDEMIPIYYDEYSNNWKKADETNTDSNSMWYNYNDKRWANVLLKDSNTIIDLSNNINNGNIIDASWDKDNGIVNTSNGYIDCGLGNYYFGDKISMILRFKFNSLSNSNQELFGNFTDNSGGGLSYSLINGSYQLNSNYYFNDEKNTFVSSNKEVSINTWYTVVVTYDGSIDSDNYKLYLNGELVGVSSANGSLSISERNMFIGYNSDITVSDAIIYKNVLSTEEISNNYKENINYNNNDNMIIYYNFMDGVDIPNGTVISDNVSDGSLAFFTWIPRYKYRVWNIEKTSSQYSYINDDGEVYEPYSSGIDIVFENTNNSSGTIKCDYIINNSYDGFFADDYTNNLTLSEVCSGNNGEYYTHPAFSFDGELNGFWVSKFEISSNEDVLYSLPDNISYTYNDINDAYNASLIFTNNSLYGINNNNYTSHLIKNIEWGAVAYLTHSKYGMCDEYSCNDVLINNSSDGYTGRSSGKDLNYGEISSNKYGNYDYKGYLIDEEENLSNNKVSNTIASTTNNIYGIYDMSGGKSEYVMASIAGMYGNISLTIEPKFYDIYSYGIEHNTQISYNRSILGDATGEIVLTPDIDNGLWYNHYNYFINYERELLTRGGSALDIEKSGQFSFEAINKYNLNEYSMRVIIS